jgi:hypothetical protein
MRYGERVDVQYQLLNPKRSPASSAGKNRLDTSPLATPKA